MKLIDKLPYFYEECPATNDIQNGLSSETNNLYNKVESTRNQLYVNSATWGLELWEKFSGVNNTEGTIEDRRLRVVAKLTAKRTTTLKVIEDLCKNYADDAVVIEIAREYKILLSLIDKTETDIPKEYNFKALDNAIWEIKPAHIEHETRISNQRKLNIQTYYEDVKFKYHPCNTLYAGELQANTYYNDKQLCILYPTLNRSDLTSSVVGLAKLGETILGEV